jgi:hypothetical protein
MSGHFALRAPRGRNQASLRLLWVTARWSRCVTVLCDSPSLCSVGPYRSRAPLCIDLPRPAALAHPPYSTLIRLTARPRFMAWTTRFSSAIWASRTTLMSYLSPSPSAAVYVSPRRPSLRRPCHASSIQPRLHYLCSPGASPYCLPLPRILHSRSVQRRHQTIHDLCAFCRRRLP